MNTPLNILQNDAAQSFFCAATWADLDSKCVNGVPEGAQACPGGVILECEDGHGCFAYACDNGLPLSTSNFSQPPPSPSDPGDYSVQDMDLLRSTFFVE